MRSTLSTASLIWRPRISATLCATILQAPVAVLPPPARGRLDRLAVLSEPGSTRARHEPAIGATAETRLVGQRQSLVRIRTTRTLPLGAVRGREFLRHDRPG